tara:strand:- start:435 stop:854 length:420 start_codon:yes stop_codon:yes gene_type:complete
MKKLPPFKDPGLDKVFSKRTTRKRKTTAADFARARKKVRPTKWGPHYDVVGWQVYDHGKGERIMYDVKKPRGKKLYGIVDYNPTRPHGRSIYRKYSDPFRTSESVDDYWASRKHNYVDYEKNIRKKQGPRKGRGPSTLM